jgi:putative glycosyltransferase (TIGR04372 family)
MNSKMKSLEAIWISFEAGIRRNRLAHKVAAAVALVIESGLSAFLYLTRVRFLRLNGPGRIGHLVADIGTFVKGRKLGRIGWYYGIFISPPGVAANESFVDYWRRYIRVVRSPFWARILTRLTRFNYLTYDVGILAINETAQYIAVEREWGDRPPLLELTGEHRRKGRAWLAAMGIPAGAELVCFHSREAGYAPRDDVLHAFRNSSVENYLPAVAELAGRGLWCIRMGDPSMRRIAATNGVIDYAHLDSRCDWLDVFLCASCRFFLGSCSGLLNLANVFGKPCAVGNQAPLSSVLGFAVNDVAIPKLLWSERERRYLTFSEALRSDISNFRFSKLYEERGVRPVENTAEDIRDLALEMLERSEGRAFYTPKDEELQQRFKALMRPGHFSYGGVNWVGRDFLRKYESLLGDRPG